ncbi:MAG: hypothetical protein HY748_11240 [Elusimicrobia bacterium]|nr:hypothetical protein [Elusimicrobiota bacterium]
MPSVMALALALILWSCILADAGGWPGTFLLALALAGIHPIAQPYLLAALALAAAASLAECGFSLRRLRIIGLIALALVASFLVQRPHLPHFLPKGMISEIYGSAGFGSISVNLPGAGQALLEAARDNRLTVGLGLGGVIFFGRGLLSTWRVCSVLLVCAAMLAGSLLHHAPGLEGVLFVRMLVPCGILAAGWAGLFCARVISRSPVWMGWVLLGLFLTFPVYKGARRYEAYMYTQLNKFSVIDSRALRRQIEDVPEGASVLYLDHPTLMMACLLEGAWRLPAVPWAMIKGSGLMSSVLRDRRPDLIVAYPYRWLNSLALIGRNELIQRRHGFYMKDFSGIAVEGPALKGRPAAILVDNPGSDFVLAVSAPAGCAALRVPAVFSGWVSIPPACSVKGRVSFDLPDRRAWILGVSVDAPRNHVRWPWGPERTVVTARFRSPFGMRSVEPGWEVSPESLSFDFSWGSLFSYDGAADALPLLRRPFEILGDDSGLVFIRTARPAGKG